MVTCMTKKKTLPEFWKIGDIKYQKYDEYEAEEAQRVAAAFREKGWLAVTRCDNEEEKTAVYFYILEEE